MVKQLKTETMCVEALFNANTNQNFVFMFVAPYENQIRLIFRRLNELIDSSPLIKKNLIRRTKNPFVIEFATGPNSISSIVGFTTGASSGTGGAGIRGQRADMIALDEMDYLGETDFENISMLCSERQDIRMVVSSTPTGRRSDFYNVCTNKALGFAEHHHPSQHNPNYTDEMDAENRATLTELGYIHEVLADFGPQDTGVFNKNKIDIACRTDNYAYEELSINQLGNLKRRELPMPDMYLPIGGKFKRNTFRCMGIDWDKYGASSSIIILDFDVIIRKFRVIRRIEVPKSEYTYDNAVNLIVELNDIYSPSWIYVDRGAGEYQIERLHIIGEERPYTGLKNKVKGFSFKEKLEIPDAVKRTTSQEPMKPFMVNQLAIAFERENILLSPYDEILQKQLIDYEVVRISQFGEPVFSNKNEHFIDALGLAYLAFVLEFPDLTKTVKPIECTSEIKVIASHFGQGKTAVKDLLSISLDKIKDPWKKGLDNDPREKDRPRYIKVSGGINKGKTGVLWGSRAGRNNSGGRSTW